MKNDTLLSTGNLSLDSERDKLLNDIKQICQLLLTTIENFNSEDDPSYLLSVYNVLNVFVDKSRGSYHTNGYDGFLKALEFYDKHTKSFNEPKYEEL